MNVQELNVENFVPYELAVKLKEKGFVLNYNFYGYRPIYSNANTIKLVWNIGAYGGKEEHYAEFPKEYLYMDDKKIQKIVDAELKKKIEEESRKKANDKKLKVEKEKAEYERLKKIYG